MNFSILALSGLLTVGLIPQVESATNQAPPILQLTQGIEPSEARVSIAKVDPKKPIQIRVINKSQIKADIVTQLMLPPSERRIVTPGGSVIFGRLHTNFLPPPLEFSIFPIDEDIILDDLELTVDNNEIVITVAGETGSSGGLRNIRVSQSGDIYLF